MKRLISTLIVLIVCIPLSYSQLRIGIIGGLHSSSVDEKNNITGWEKNTSPYFSRREGVHIGIMSSIPLGINNLYFEPALLYQTKGRKFARYFDTSIAKVTDTAYFRNDLFLNYVEFPLNLTYRIPFRKKANFVLSAGPYLAFFFNGKRKVATLSYNDNIFRKYDEDVQAGIYNDKVQTLDIGFNGRAGFEVGAFMLSVYASKGLSNFYTAPYGGTFHHQQFGATIGMWINNSVPAEKRPRQPRPKDADNDGLIDSLDACPLQWGTALMHGCPDKDGDGVADNTDKCPDVAGLAKYGGCPIPDTDKDGVNDEEDKCPIIPGILLYKGCPTPDKDGDGIPDDRDKCPDVPGTSKFRGCPPPDADNDSIPDDKDKCPSVAGPRENNGCPLPPKKDIADELRRAAKKILFTANSDLLTIGSYQALNEVAAILKGNPEVKLDIEGYTDNSGQPALNRDLSQKRADAVKRYLMQWHIDGNRLRSVGYGPQRPIADNKTSDGRAQNRRVEFKLVQQ